MRVLGIEEGEVFPSKNKTSVQHLVAAQRDRGRRQTLPVNWGGQSRLSVSRQNLIRAMYDTWEYFLTVLEVI